MSHAFRHSPLSESMEAISAEDFIDRLNEKISPSGSTGKGKPPPVEDVLRVIDKHIIGTLDLDHSHIDLPLIFERCLFDFPIILKEASVCCLEFEDCYISGLDASNIESRGDVIFKGTVSVGEINLSGARLKHNLHFDDTTIYAKHSEHPKRDDRAALFADLIWIDGDCDLSCNNGFTSVGGVIMNGAHIKGYMRMKGALLCDSEDQEMIDGEECKAFDGDGIVVEQDFDATSLHVKGKFTLIDARISCSLIMKKARFSANGDALRLDRARIGGSVFISDEFKMDGSVKAIVAHIGGTLYLQHGHISAPEPEQEAVCLVLSRIDGDFHIKGLEVEGKISIDDIAVHGNLNLVDSCIGLHALSIASKQLNAPAALNARRLHVSGSVRVHSDVRGRINMGDAHIIGHLSIEANRIDYASDQAAALDLMGSRIGVLKIEGPSKGITDLTRAVVGVLKDRPSQWKNDPGKLVLEDLKYSILGVSENDCKDRISWLHNGTELVRGPDGEYVRTGKMGRFLPSPYEELSAAYQATGHDDFARRVLFEKYKRRRQDIPWLPLGWRNQAWQLLQEWLIGYGYSPVRALVAFVLAWLAGTIFFWLHSPQPTPKAISNGQVEGFTFVHAITYTLDLLIPIFSLQEDSYWRSIDNWGALATAFIVLFGWILGATIVAATARVTTR